MNEKIIHFGEFIRWNRVSAGKTTEAFGRDIGLTARRVIAIEAMALPDVQHTTMVALARALHINPEEFDAAWKNTPVPITRRKMGPTTDEARLFSIACAHSNVTPVEGMRRLRSWIVAQNEETQKQALSYLAEHRQHQSTGMFTDPVDHLQDPVDQVRKRLGRRAATAAKPPGSASTPAGKRH